ncbi:phage tail assembly chaperone G [Escherichia coli]|uniref:phage tail assembly chaperone G n=1 Tax=Escherichia coli TaxID=562 RepID=UPI00135E3B3E|nr:phage minor tail protein G [Escherichia coli]MXF06686.1 phage minor tail protein G [Escherichia coli]
MFLKKEMFNYGGQTVELSELSGLQRMDYLTFVQQQTTAFDAVKEDQPVAERQIAFLRMGTDINAWLVSRSLWNADQSQDVESLYSTVRVTWSYEALGLAGERILVLSGMRLVSTDGEQAEVPQSPEKS